MIRLPSINKGRLRAVPDIAYPILLLIWIVVVCCPLSRVVADRDAFIEFTHTGKASLADFVKFYSVGLICRSPDRTKLYDPQVQNAYVTSVLDNRNLHQGHLGQYTPQFCVAMAPLSLLPINLSYGLWMVATLACLILSLNALSAGVPGLEGGRCSLYFYALLLSTPVAIFNVLLGQAGFLLGALAGLFWLAFLRKNDWGTGVALALFVLKPQYLPYLAITCLAGRRYKSLLVALAWACLLTLATVAYLGWDTLVAYPKFLHDCEFGGMTADWWLDEAMISWRGVASLFLSQSAIGYLTVPVALAGALGCYVIWRASMGAAQSSATAVLSITCLSLLTSGHTHIYDVLLLGAPLAVLFSRPSWAGVFAGKNDPDRWLLLLFLAYPAVSWILYLQGPVDWAVKSRWQGLYVLLLLAVSLWRLAQQLRQRH